MPTTLQTEATTRRYARQASPALVFNFINYTCIGLPLAILPTYVHLTLGVSTLFAGLLISLQYVATFASRPKAGHLADHMGPRNTVRYGLLTVALSGLALLAAPLTHHKHGAIALCIAFLVISRLIIGIGESLIGVGAVMWGIGRVDERGAAQVISWNGVGTYLGLGLGAPLGAIMQAHWGIASVGLLTTLLCLAGYIVATRIPGTPPVHGEKVALRVILLGVTPYGLALALGGTGFGVIASFITLYFAQLGWSGAALSLTVYGLSFVVNRVLFAGLIARAGGFRVAIVSFAIEAAGLALIGRSHTHTLVYLGCALTGGGFSLIFPALGIEASNAFPVSVRGTVLGAYCAFADFSFFLSGPLAGAIIHRYGYPNVFTDTAFAVLLALALTALIALRTRHLASATQTLSS